MSSYSISRVVAGPFSEAVNKVKAALAAEGFGVLTEIDVEATIKKKLNKDFMPYIILGACNPPFAHEALITETEIGLMMPCNVILYEKSGTIYVATVRPTLVMQTTGNTRLAPLAEAVEKKLQSVIGSL